ncbi:MAG: hypothetical protein ACFE0O_10040 [Opitutales bacterium]
MKTSPIILAALVAVGLTARPQTAQAGSDEALAAVGGLIGGVIIANIADRDAHRPRHYKHQDRSHRGDTTVIIHKGHRVHKSHGHPRDGYWKHKRIREWVPGHWTWVSDGCRQYRKYQPGYYKTRIVKVWVPRYRDDGCRVAYGQRGQGPGHHGRG